MRRAYQIDGIRRLVKMQSGILADDAGLGKTLQSLFTIKILKGFPLFIICPAFLKDKWGDEIKKWVNVDYSIFYGNEGDYTKPICICNYEILSKHISSIKSCGFKSLIVDESHYIRNADTDRFKFVFEISRTIQYKILLSASPIVNSRKDLYNQLRIINKEYLLKTVNNKKSISKETARTINATLRKTCMVRRIKKNVLKDLPPAIEDIIYLELDNRVGYINEEKKYKEFKDKISRLGFLERLRNLCAKGKLEQYKEWVKSLNCGGNKVVTFAWHKNILSRLDGVKINGEISVNDRYEIIKKAGDENLNINYKSGGEGIDLPQYNYCGFLELPYSPAIITQCVGRLHRIGQRKTVFSYLFIAKNSIEEKILQIIRDKDLCIKGLLREEEVREYCVNEIFKELETKYG